MPIPEFLEWVATRYQQEGSLLQHVEAADITEDEVLDWETLVGGMVLCSWLGCRRRRRSFADYRQEHIAGARLTPIFPVQSE